MSSCQVSTISTIIAVWFWLPSLIFSLGFEKDTLLLFLVELKNVWWHFQFQIGLPVHNFLILSNYLIFLKNVYCSFKCMNDQEYVISTNRHSTVSFPCPEIPSKTWQLKHFPAANKKPWKTYIYLEHITFVSFRMLKASLSDRDRIFDN